MKQLQEKKKTIIIKRKFISKLISITPVEMNYK